MVFFIFSNILTFKRVLDHISILSAGTTSEGDLKEFHIIIVPNIFHIFTNLLEAEGLVGKVQLHRFSWDFIKVDRNLLSLEIPSVFNSVFIKKDKSLLNSIANSLRIFQMIHKSPKIFMSIGENSENVLKMMTKMEKVRKPSEGDCDFDGIVIMDRDIDYASCLLTPVTYSALMIELYDVKAGILNLEVENKIESGKFSIFKDFKNIKEDKNDENEVKSLRMCGNSDELYNFNKFRHFSEVLKSIKEESKNVEEEKRKYSRDMSIEQMKDFVEQNLPKVAQQKKNLFKHLIICEKIVQELSLNFERLQNIEEMIIKGENRKQILGFIDELMATNPHKHNVLRLAALFHLFNGISGEDLQKLISNFLNTFGHQNLHVFQNLFKAKLLPDFLNPTKNFLNIKKTNFMVDAQKFKLIPITSENEEKKVCPSYVFNQNFIPLISQLALNILKAENSEELKNKLNNFDVKFKSDENVKSLKEIQNFPLKVKKLFIFVIGGISYAEIAACNVIESLTGTTIVLGSDEVTCGSNLIKYAMEK